MIKELAIEFIGRGEVRGFFFTQLIKSNKGYLYQVKTPYLGIHYEVFQKIINKRFNIISYPRSASFGIYAWCILNYEDAIQKFNQL